MGDERWEKLKAGLYDAIYGRGLDKPYLDATARLFDELKRDAAVNAQRISELKAELESLTTKHRRLSFKAGQYEDRCDKYGSLSLGWAAERIDLKRHLARLEAENARLGRDWDAVHVLLEEALADNTRLRATVRELRGALEDHGKHNDDCLWEYWEAGEPTEDGGYRTKFKGKWYTKNPPCTCGLSAALATEQDEPPSYEQQVKDFDAYCAEEGES